MIIIKIIITLVVVVFVAGYRWEVYREETMWDEKKKLWSIIKNIGMFIITTIITLLILFHDGEIDERTLQHYEPRF